MTMTSFAEDARAFSATCRSIGFLRHVVSNLFLFFIRLESPAARMTAVILVAAGGL